MIFHQCLKFVELFGSLLCVIYFTWISSREHKYHCPDLRGPENTACNSSHQQPKRNYDANNESNEDVAPKLCREHGYLAYVILKEIHEFFPHLQGPIRRGWVTLIITFANKGSNCIHLRNKVETIGPKDNSGFLRDDTVRVCYDSNQYLRQQDNSKEHERGKENQLEWVFEIVIINLPQKHCVHCDERLAEITAEGTEISRVVRGSTDFTGQK
mmetsp:Transcript_6490/g.19133  ORF Transcript_6490/g.19133 Transcript_6490/m.19133 type:complete len:213 (-) Transcript_6490:1859-2497(-)